MPFSHSLAAPPRALASFEFHPDKNDNVVVTSLVDAGSSCSHNFAEGPGYHFDSVTIDRAPEHGELKQTRDTRFVFTPNPRFPGKDFYLFKICAATNPAVRPSLSSRPCGGGGEESWAVSYTHLTLPTILRV